MALPSAITVNRMEAAAMLGVSKTSIRRLEEAKELHGTIGARGEVLFQIGDVHALKQKRSTHHRPDPLDDGVLAAKAFSLFDAGSHPVQVVQRLRASPRAIAALHAEWEQMRGGIVLSSEDLRLLSPLLPREHVRIRNSNDLIREMRAVMLRTCARCKKQPARFCGSCLAHRAAASSAEEEAFRAMLEGSRPPIARSRAGSGPTDRRSPVKLRDAALQRSSHAEHSSSHGSGAADGTCGREDSSRDRDPSPSE